MLRHEPLICGGGQSVRQSPFILSILIIQQASLSCYGDWSRRKNTPNTPDLEPPTLTYISIIYLGQVTTPSHHSMTSANTTFSHPT